VHDCNLKYSILQFLIDSSCSIFLMIYKYRLTPSSTRDDETEPSGQSGEKLQSALPGKQSL